jgi:hypothetical protein
MSTVDDKIVAMKFDNRQFDPAVASSTSALEKLKAALKLDGVGKGLNEVNNAAKGFSLAGMASGVDGLSTKFMALATIGITALSNITNRAVDAGIRLGKSLSLDQVMAGFREYELKMGSIQTILANTARHGTGLAEVTANLDALNDYADKTIYNFGDMTRNIGLFTNAGIKVGDATSMIKGFSNEAAASGTSAQGAAGAAYQLSQALSAGTIRLMDWRSLQNVGMGNKNMQNGLIEIASAMGQFNSSTTTASAASKDFNGSLEKQWLSADVMSNYLKIMAGDMDDAAMSALGLSDAQIKSFKAQQTMSEEAATKVRTLTQLVGTIKESIGSSWAETFDLLIGDFNEATALWSGVNKTLGDLLGSFGDKRNEMLQGWKELGGRTELIEGIKNIFTALGQVLTPIRDAFRNLFPPQTAQGLYNLTVAFRSFTENLKIGSDTASRIGRIFTGIFSVFHLGVTVVKLLVSTIASLFGVATKGSGGFLEFVATIGDWVAKVSQAIEKGTALQAIFGNIGLALKGAISFVKAFAGGIFKIFSDFDGFKANGFAGFGQTLLDSLGPFKSVAQNLGNIFGRLTGNFGSVWDTFSSFGSKFADFFKKFSERLRGFTGDLDFTKILGAINTGALIAVATIFYRFVKSFGDGVDTISSWKETLTSPFEAMTDTLGQMQNTLKAATLLQIAAAIGILALSAVALSKIDAEGLTRALTALTVMLVQLVGAMAIFQKIDIGSGMGQLILLAVALRILTSSVKALSELSWEDLAKGLTGTAALLGALIVTAKLMPDGKAMISSSVGIILLAAAVKILVSSVQDLGSMDWEDLAKGLIGVGAVLGALILFTKFAEANKGGIAQSVGILLLGAAIKVLASAVEDFSKMDWTSLGKGLASISAILLAVAAFGKISSGGVSLLGAGAAMLVISAAMKIMASAIKDFTAFSWEEIGRGMTVMAGSLLAVGLALALIPPTSVFSAGAIAITAYALGMLADVMKDFGKMGWDEISKSITMLAGSLTILGLALFGMTYGLAGAPALFIAAAALAVLAPVLQAFGKMSWTEIGKGLAMLAGALAVLGIAGALLTPVIPTLLGLGIAIALLGVGMLAAGAGLMFFSVALTTLAAGGAATAAAIVAIVSGLLGLIPMAMEQIGLGLIAFAGVIATSGPAITEAFVAVLTSLLDAIATTTPKIISTLGTLIDAMLTYLANNTNRFVDSGMKILIGFLKGVADNIGKVVDTAVSVIVNFINGVTRNLDRIIQAGVSLIIAFVSGLARAIRNNQAQMNRAGQDLAGAIISGMISGITSGASSVARAAVSMATSAWNAAKRALGINSPSKKFMALGRDSALGMVVGIEKNTSQVSASASAMGSNMVDAMRKTLSDMPNWSDLGLDTRPVISPVLDLSNVDPGNKALKSIFDSQTVNVGSAASKAHVAQSMWENRSVPDSSLVDTTVSTGDTYNLVQNNTSPKALSSAEIYRNTRNLISVVTKEL